MTGPGPGIPADEQDRVLEIFWRGRRDTPGTGLGLPIAHQVAIAHGRSSRSLAGIRRRRQRI